MRPIALILEFSPLLVFWILAICFFVCVAGTAIISRGRRWFELGCIFLLSYTLLAAIGLVGAYLFVDSPRAMHVEVIETPTPYSASDD